MEHRVRQEFVFTTQVRRQKLRARGGREPEGPLLGAAEHLGERVQLARRRGLVDGNADRVAVAEPQLESALAGRLDDSASAPRHVDDDRVEEVVEDDLVTGVHDPIAQQVRFRGDVGRDSAQAAGTVVDGVHGGHDGQQHLGGADVRGRLLAPDVLLAGLQGESVGGCAGGILRDADEAPGKLPLEARADGHVPGVRTAEAHRHPEALRRADGDVRS